MVALLCISPLLQRKLASLCSFPQWAISPYVGPAICSPGGGPDVLVAYSASPALRWSRRTVCLCLPGPGRFRRQNIPSFLIPIVVLEVLAVLTVIWGLWILFTHDFTPDQPVRWVRSTRSFRRLNCARASSRLWSVGWPEQWIRGNRRRTGPRRRQHRHPERRTFRTRDDDHRNARLRRAAGPIFATDGDL